MNKGIKHTVILLGLLLLPSCAKELAESGQDGLVATIEAPAATKMSVADPVPGEHYGAFTWDDDTRIAIHTDTGGGSFIIARMEEKSTDGKTATFRPTLTGTRDGYAVFPYTAADGGYPGVDERGLRVYWHKEHYVDNSRADWKEYYTARTESPMVAVNDPNSTTLDFKHLGGVLRLHIDQIPNRTKYLKIRSLDPDPPIQGSYIVDMSGAEPVVSAVSGEVERSVNFVFSTIILNGLSSYDAVGAINNVVLNLPVPPGTYNSLRVQAFRETYGNSYNQNTSNLCRYNCTPVTVARGQVADVEVNMQRSIGDRILFNYNKYDNPSDLTLTKLLTPVKVVYKPRNINDDGWVGADGDMHLTCSMEDPSIAQVYVQKTASGAPEIMVFGVAPGTTKMHAWVRRRSYDDEVHGTLNVIVSPTSTFTVISPTTSMDTGSTMDLTVSSVPEGAGDRTLDYTWRIVTRSGASGATLASDKQKAVLTAGAEKGWVDINCDISYNGSAPVTSATLKILIGDAARPDGTVDGLFKVSATKLVYFGRANLYATKADPDKYRFTEHQYDVMYSKDPGWSDNCIDPPYSFDEYDLFPYNVPETVFSSAATSPAVYWNNNDVDSSTGWYVLTWTEWNYLLKTRRASTVSGTADARYLRARVGVHYGIVIFPDTYIHPVSVQALPGDRINKNNAVPIDIRCEEWEDMEQAGAVFLPAAGVFQSSPRRIYYYHDSGVFYWSGAHRYFSFLIDTLDNKNTDDSSEGDYKTSYAAVRLVKNVF